MKRREFVKAALVLPVASVIHLPSSPQDPENWKDRMKREIEAHMDRSEIISRIKGYGSNCGTPSLFLSSDARIVSHPICCDVHMVDPMSHEYDCPAKELTTADLGTRIPWFRVGFQSSFIPSAELTTIETTVEGFEHRLGCIEQALLNRADQNGFRGNLRFAHTPGEFYGVEKGQPVTGPYNWTRSEYLKESHRAMLYTMRCQMTFG